MKLKFSLIKFGYNEYARWCIFSRGSFSFFKLNFKAGKFQTSSCMARLFFGSIIWILWQKTLYGVFIWTSKCLIQRGFFYNDGDHQAKESNATEEDKEGQRSVKEVKEIHTMVRNALTISYYPVRPKTGPVLCIFCSKKRWVIFLWTFTLFKLKESAFQKHQPRFIWSPFGWSYLAPK